MKKLIIIIAALAAIALLASPVEARYNAISLAPCLKVSCTASIDANLSYDRPTRVRVWAMSATGRTVMLTDQVVPDRGTAWSFVATSPYGAQTFQYSTNVLVHGKWVQDNRKQPYV